MLAGIQAGSVLAERYEILGVLGQGSLGTVYKAQDRLLDETVALKTIDPQAAVPRLPTAARAARQASARNVCRIHDYGEHEGTRFVSMEFVDGIDLRAGTRAAALPAREACDLVLQLCGALASVPGQADAAHGLGLLLSELITGQEFSRDPAAEVPPSLAAFLTRALARNANDRFASTAEMVSALRECLGRLSDEGHDGVETRTAEAPSTPAEEPRPHPMDVETLVAMLATGLSEGDAGLRWRSALALAELGPAAFAAVPALIQALDDSDLSVRQRASRALARIGPAAVTPLMAALGARPEHVRFLAAEALTEIGSTPRPTPTRADAPMVRWPESRY